MQTWRRQDDRNYEPWVFLTFASIPQINPLKPKRPIIFGIIDYENHERLQLLLEDESDWWQITETYCGINAICYSLYERRTTITGMMMGTLTNMACHSRFHIKDAMSALRSVIKVCVEIQDTTWLVAAINALTMSLGHSFISRGIRAAAASDYPVRSIEAWFKRWIGAELCTNVTERQHLLQTECMKEFLQTVIIDTILMKASLALETRHGTRPISFQHFSHGNCVRHDLQTRVDTISEWSDERAFALIVLKICDDVTSSMEERVRYLRAVLDSKKLGESSCR